MSNWNSGNDRLSARRFRLPVAVSGAALLGLSLLLSVGPALGANNNSNGNGGNGTSGNLKVHDVGTGVETSGNDNEPHVCDFWLVFTLDAPFEAGTWVMVSWAPTGDGSTVASGAYDTSGDGVDNSDVIELPAGHYRVEWAATGASVTSKKTFWVDADCDETVTPGDESPADESPAEESASPAEESEAEDTASPVEDAAPLADESPAEESAGTDEESPVEDAESPVEESVLTDDQSPAEDPGTPSDESPVEDSEPSGEGSVLANEGSPSDEADSPADEADSPADEPVSDDPGQPSDESPATPADPSDEEDPAEAVVPGSSGPGTSHAQDLLGESTSDEPTMADTAAPIVPVPSGIVATCGVVLLIVVHATARRRQSGDVGA